VASEKALIASLAWSTVNLGHRTDQSPMRAPEGEHVVRPTSAAHSPVRNATITLCTAAGSRLENVVAEQTAAAARAPVHNPVT
jgi:hypothetical protein